ncbi:kinase-like domain-containing protein [Glomus cerebriforme]|uniref:Kinase-like domain-containing protein n=1 Tax=Glomus cerebriforme TaxID=658196 RepID=A0A397SD29_9GLOM|nr:kinase-like domain-containing protein [Glomus cerebriforme]
MSCIKKDGKLLQTDIVELDTLLCDIKADLLSLNRDDFLVVYDYNWFTDINIIKKGSGRGSTIWKAKLKHVAENYIVLKESPSIGILINEIKAYYQCIIEKPVANLIHIHGVTKNTCSGMPMLVIEYAQEGDLKECLNLQSPSWETKIQILLDIISGLKMMHNAGYVHKDLHIKNILCFKEGDMLKAKIADLGESCPISTIQGEIYGVLPYMAPEFLEDTKYTFASDVYSFGIIIIKLSTEEEKDPFWSRRDWQFPLEICEGLRPELSPDTPEIYADLCKSCTDTNPKNRPTAQKIGEILISWITDGVFKIT